MKNIIRILAFGVVCGLVGLIVSTIAPNHGAEASQEVAVTSPDTTVPETTTTSPYPSKDLPVTCRNDVPGDMDTQPCSEESPPLTTPPTTHPTPVENTRGPDTTWEALGFDGLVPLSIEQVMPEMNVCRAVIGDGGHTRDIYVMQVLEFVLHTEDAESFASSPYRILGEESYYSEYEEKTMATWDLWYSDDMGLTGNRTDSVRTYAGTCEDPISAEFVTEEELPESL